MANNQQEQIQQLQNIEQHLQVLLAQKQTFQSQLLEIDNALSELEKTNDKVYKIIGAIMVLANKDSTKSELEERKKVLELRIKSIESQERNFKQKAEDIQEELVKDLK